MLETTKQFFNESAQELRKVTWPTRQEVTASTGVVLLVVVFFVLLLVLVDYLIKTGLGFFFKI